MKWHPLVHRTKELFTKHFGVRSGDTLLAAVSGGADSICMLHLLHTLSAPLQLSLCCVHVHHGIRGVTADRDAAFVRAFCEERSIPFALKKVDATAYAAAHPHVSPEEAARVLRYAALEEDVTAPRTFLCTAHNADDNAETVLLHLFRGTGLRGLAGMPERRPGQRTTILRPLLSVTRAEIEAYNDANGLSFVEDETNEDTAYTRNALRHEILPVAAEKINAKASLHITENAREVAELLHWVEGQTGKGFERCRLSAEDGGLRFSVRALRAEEPFLQGEILRMALQDSPAQKQITRTHIEDILALVRSDNGRAALHLPGGLTAEREHDALRLLL